MTQFDYAGMFRSAQYGPILDQANLDLGDRPIQTLAEQKVAVMACRAASCLGKWGEAVDWAERGLAFEDGQNEDLGWLHFSLGSALLFIGDVYRSERAFQAFHELAIVTPTLEKVLGPDGLFNWGFLKRSLRQTEAEIRLFREARAAYAGQNRFRSSLQAGIEVVWTLLIANKRQEAEAELAAILPALQQHGDAELRIDVGIEQAFISRLADDLEGSQHLLESLWARQDLLFRQRAEVAWLAGCNSLSTGDAATAKYWADAAFRNAAEDWFPQQIQRISDLRKSLLSLRGN